MASSVLPTIDEVRAAEKEAQRQAWPRWVISAIAVLSSLAAATLGAHRLADIATVSSSIIFLAFILGVLIGIPLLCLALQRWYQRPFVDSRLLHCAHCHNRIGYLTCAIGNCSHCGRRAIHLSDTPSSKPMTILQFNEAQQRVERHTNWIATGGLAAFFVGLAMAAAGVAGMESPGELSLLRGCALIAGGLVALGACIAMTLLLSTLMRRYSCSACRIPFSRNVQSVPLVIATGNCPHCGQQVIEDPLHGK